MFTDRVTLELIAGKGGNGIVAWKRERYLPKGGPMGGNGGKGGDIILRADDQVPSLEWFRNRKKLSAQNGSGGGTNGCNGKQGQPLVLKIPCGTLVKDVESGEVLHDFTFSGEELIVCSGGRGGRGNRSFRSSTNRAPNICTDGKLGEIKSLELELKIIADVGLVGFPNAGKSTLISAITAAPVKIAPYPFTTLRPNLGYIDCEDYTRILIADIPGIIAGASNDKGLGLEFLRHIERTKVLVYVLDASGIDGRNPWDDFVNLKHEIRQYNAEMLEKPFLILLNKADTKDSEEHIQDFLKNYDNDHSKLFMVSASEKVGLETFLKSLQHLL